MERQEIDVTAAIDRARIGGYQVWLLVLCGAIITLDGFDIQALGYIAPTLSKSWTLAPGALGPVFSANLFGMMIGALAAGPLSDRYGRKPLLTLSTAWFGVCSLATAWADSLPYLTGVRFLTGLGLGAVMPTAIALAAEFSPARRRASMVMFMFCGQSLGSVLGGALAAKLAPAWGWQAVFVVGGALPILLAMAVGRFLSESPPLMVRLGAPPARIRAVMARLDPSRAYDEAAVFTAPAPEEKGSVPSALFGRGRAFVTLPLWVLFASNLLVIYFLANWMPTVINDSGLPVETAIYVSMLYHVGAIAGALTLGRAIERFGPFATLTAILLLAAGFVAALGAAGAQIVLLVPLVFAAGYCVVGAQNAANVAAAASYPTHVRSTGVGWALGIGRIGSIAGPILGGYLIAQQVGTPDLFKLAALPELIAALAAIYILVKARRRPAAKVSVASA